MAAPRPTKNQEQPLRGSPLPLKLFTSTATIGGYLIICVHPLPSVPICVKEQASANPPAAAEDLRFKIQDRRFVA